MSRSSTLAVCGSEIATEKVEETDVYKKFLHHCPLFPGFIKIKPGNTLMPECYLNFYENMKGFKRRDDDVWVASFPKSGTTWTQEMVWNIMNNVDLETANNVNLDLRVPFLEINGIKESFFKKLAEERKDIEKESKPEETAREEGKVDKADHPLDYIKIINNLPEDKPRIIKTHLPVELLPKEVLEKHKIVYVSRNPRDVVLSWYNHWTILEGYNGDFDSFFDAFIEDVAGYYSPFFNNNIGFWNLRNNKNILFIFYEDMKKDLKSVIRKVSDFLDKQLSNGQVESLFDHLQFDKMKNNPAVNKEEIVERVSNMTGKQAQGKFMNKGISGGWKNRLTEDQINRIKTWEQDKLQHTDLTFQYQ